MVIGPNAICRAGETESAMAGLHELAKWAVFFRELC